MFKHVYNRSEELKLLNLAVTTAKFNKDLIEQLELFEVETKKNGVQHKGKETKRLKLIKDLKAENKYLKQFFIKGNTPEKKERYSLNVKTVRGRNHLDERSYTDLPTGIFDSQEEYQRSRS